MKQLLEEIERISGWCDHCPYTEERGVYQIPDKNGPMSDKEYYQEVEKAFSDKYGCAGIIELYDEESCTYKPIVECAEEIPGEEAWWSIPSDDEIQREEEAKAAYIPSEEEIQDNWEACYNSSIDKDRKIWCPHIRKRGLELHIHRDFEIPASKEECLRIFDKILSCRIVNCGYNSKTKFGAASVTNLMQKAVAKIDFALKEKGLDFYEELGAERPWYYHRLEDLHLCGQSDYLINKYFPSLYNTNAKSYLNSPLSSAEAIRLLNRLVESGYCDEQYQWYDKSKKTLMSEFAAVISSLLFPDDKVTHWKHFQDLWQVKRLAVFHDKRAFRPYDSEVLNIYPEYKERK